MAWYNTGTVSVTNNSTAVTGAGGTAWVANGAGGMGFRGPDRAIYEVQSINSDNSLTLATPYQGSTATGQTYSLMPTQDYMRVLAGQVSSLIASYSTIATNAGAGKFGDGAVGAPGITFGSDTDTGFYRYGSNVIGVVSGGVLKAKFGSWGFSVDAGSTALSTAPVYGGFGIMLNANGGADTFSPAITFDIGGGGGRAAIYTTRGGAAGGRLVLATETGGGVMTEALRVNELQRLLIGTSSPSHSGKLHVSDGIGATTLCINSQTLPTGNQRLGMVAFSADTETAAGAARIEAFAEGAWTTNSSTPAYLDFSTTPSGSATRALRARIDSSGRLLVNTTSTAYSNSRSFALDPTSGAEFINHSNTNASADTYVGFGYNGAAIGSITQSGTTGVAFNTTSDRRLKDNITPAGDAGAAIDSIQVVQHDWRADGSHVDHGVIAQDLHAVYPSAVTPGDTGDEITQAWGVDYSKLVPLLVKEVQSLRARVASLEASA